MPLEVGALPARLSVTVQDRDGNTAEAVRYVSGILTIIDAELALRNFEAAVAGLTNGRIISGSLTIPTTQTDAPFLPPEASDVERKGVFIFEMQDGRKARYSVPSLRNELVTDLSRQGIIDPTQAPVIAYRDLMVGSRNGGGVPLTRLDRSFKKHRASGKESA